MSNPEEIARPAESVRTDGTYSPLDIDQNGVVDALTDGLLLLRYLFGLSGDGVTKGAMAADATRTAEEALEYLDWIKTHEESDLYKAFDLDNSGDLDALTDGLIFLRSGFGLDIESATDGAIAKPILGFDEDGAGLFGEPYATAQEVAANLDKAINVLQQVPRDDEGNYGVTDSTPEPEPQIDDLDGDGIPDDEDDDDDGDGISDILEIEDQETNNIYDEHKLAERGIDDSLRLDPRVFNKDSDGDTVPDGYDFFPDDASEQVDFDLDGVGGNADADDLDSRILESFDDYVLAYPDEDYDDDGVLNKDDAFPNNPDFTTDTDEDGLPDERDPDKDGDGVDNAEDTLELNPDVWNEAQYDVWYEQQDDDGDGMENYRDPFPNDEFNGEGPPKDDPRYEAWYAEQDFDNDGVLNPDDPAPYLKDVKNDYEYEQWHYQARLAEEGIWGGESPNTATYDQIFVTPEQYDPEDPFTYDTDGDGIRDSYEMYIRDDIPLDHVGLDTWGVMERSDMEGGSDQGTLISYDPTLTWMEYAQALGDWKTPNNDIDGDGVSNLEDAFVYSGEEWEDVDEDGLGDNLADDNIGEVSDALLDSDGDGHINKYDDFPYNPNEHLDSDGDGIGDEGDFFPNDPEKSLMPDMDGDGVEDSVDLFPTDPTKTGYTEAEVAARDAEIAKQIEEAGYVNYHAMNNDDSLSEAEEKGRIRFEEKMQEYADRFYTHTPGSYNHQDTDYLEELLDLDEIAEFSKYHEYYSIISNSDHPSGFSGAKAIVYQGYPRPLTTEELWQGYQSIMSGDTPLDPRHQQDMTARMSGASSNIPVGYIFHRESMAYDYSDMSRNEDDDLEGPLNYKKVDGYGSTPNWGTGDTWTARDYYTGFPLESEEQTLNMARAGAIPVIKNGYWNEDLAKLRVGLSEYRSDRIAAYQPTFYRGEFNGFMPTEEYIRRYGDDEYLHRMHTPDELRINANLNNQAQVMHARRLLAEQYVLDMSQGHLWKKGSVVTGQAIPFRIQSGENPDGTPIYLDEGFDTKYNVIDEFENPSTYYGDYILPMRGLDPTAGLIRGADVIPTEREIVEAYYSIRSPMLGENNKTSADAWLASQDEVVQEIFNDRETFVEPDKEFIDKFIDYVGLDEVLKSGGVQYIPMETWDGWVNTLRGGNKKAGEELKSVIRDYQRGEYLDFAHIGILTEFNAAAEPDYSETTISTDSGTGTMLSELARVNSILGYQDAWRNAGEQPEYTSNYDTTRALDWDSYQKQQAYSNAYGTAASSGDYNVQSTMPTHHELFYDPSTDTYQDGSNLNRTSAGGIQYMPASDYGWYKDAATKMVNRFNPPLYMTVENQGDLDRLWTPEDRLAYEEGEQGAVWRDNTRLYMKLPDSRIDVEAGYKAYQTAIESGKTEAQAQEAAEAAENPNDLYLMQDSTGTFTNAVPSNYYAKGGWDREGGAYPTDEYAGNSEYGGFWIDTSNGTAPIGSYTMMYIAQPKPIVPEKKKWYEKVIDVALIVTAIWFPQTYLIIQGARALSGETLKTNDYLGIVLSGLKVGGKLKMPSKESVAVENATKAQEAAEAAAIADGLTGGTLLASIGQAAYDAAYITEINGVGIFGLTARQSVALINAAATGDIGSAVVSSFGQDYISKGFENLGVDSSIYTDMDPSVKLGLNKTMEYMLDGDSFNEALTKGGVEGLAEYISNTGYSSEIQKIIKDFMGDLSPAINGIKDLFNVDALDGALDSITGIVSEDVLRDLAIAFEEVGDVGGAIIGIAEKGLDIVDENIIAPVVDLVGDTASAAYQSLKSVDEIFPDGMPEGITEQISTLAGGLEDGLKATYGSLDDAAKRAMEVSVAQLIVNGELDELGLERAFTKELITTETVAGLLEVDGLSAVGPEVLTQAVRTAMTTGMAGGNASKAFMQTLATAAANSLKYAVQVGGIEGLTREIGQFWDNVSGQKTKVENNVKTLAELKAEADSKVGQIQTATATLQERQDRLNELYSAAIAEDANDADREAFLAYSDQYLDTLPTLEQNINELKGDLSSIDFRYDAEYSEYLSNVEKIEEYSRESNPNLQAEYDNLNVYMASQLSPNFDWEEYAEVNNLGDVSIVEASQHFVQEGYVSGAPLTTEDYNARIRVATNEFVDTVAANAGVDLASLNPNSRASIRNAILTEVSSGADSVSLNPLQFLEMLGDNKPMADEYIAGTDYGNVIVQAYNQSYITAEGAPLNFTNLGEVENHQMEQRANQFINAYLPIDINTGAPVDPAEYSQYLTDLIDGQLFVSLNEDGDYTWDAATETIKYNALTGLQEVVDTTPGKTLSQLAAEDPIFYMRTLGELEDNVAAINLVRKVTEETGLPGAIPAYDDVPLPGSTEYADLPWIVRVSRDIMTSLADRRQNYLDVVEELESLEGPLTLEQENRLAQATLDYGKADSDLFNAEALIDVSSSLVGYWNTVGEVFSISGQEGRARQEGVRAQHNAATAGASIEEAREVGAKVTQSMLEEIDYNSLTNNELARNITMLQAFTTGHLPQAYQEDVSKMYEVMGSGEGFWGGVFAAGESAVKYPRAFAHEIVKKELVETTLQFAVTGVGGVATRVAAKELGSSILETITKKNADLLTTSLGQDAIAEYSSVVTEIYDTAYARLQNTPEYLAADDAGKEYLLGQYAEAVYAKAVEGGTVAMAVFLAAVPLEGKLDNLLARNIFGDAGLDAVQELANADKKILDVVGEVIDTSWAEGKAEFLQEGATSLYSESAYHDLGVPSENPDAQVGAAAAIGLFAGTSTTAIIAPTAYVSPQDQVANSIDDPFGRLIVSTNDEVYQAVQSGDVNAVRNLMAAAGFAAIVPMNLEMLNATDDSYILTASEVTESYAEMGLEAPEGFAESMATTYTIDSETGEVSINSPLSDDDTLDQQLAEQWDIAFPSDSDNDGVIDREDAFPNDASETADSDNDGVGDNADVFPNDASETVDSDNDGVGDNSDIYPTDDRFSDVAGFNEYVIENFEGLEAENKELQEQLDTQNDLLQQVSDLAKDKEQLEQDKVALQGKYDTDIGVKNTEIDELNISIGGLTTQIETLSTAALTAGETVEARNKSIEDLAKQKEGLETNLATEQKAKADLQAKYDADIGAKNTAIDELNISIGGLNTTIAEQAGTIENQAGTIGDQTKTIAQLTADKLTLEGSLAEEVQAKANLQGKYDTDIGVKNTEIGGLTNSIGELTTQIETLSTAALTAGETVEARNKSIEDLTKQKEGLETNLATEQKAKADLQAKYDVDISAKNTAIDELNTSIGGLNTTIAEQAGTIENQAGTIGDQSADITDLKTALETTAEVLGVPANEVTEEDIALVTDYLAGVELAQDKVDNITRYDVTGQDDLVTQEDLDLLSNAYTLGDYTGFDPDADFNPATGTYLTVEEKNAEIAAQNQAAIDRELEYEAQLEQELAQRTSEVTSNIQTQVQAGVDEIAEKEEEKRKANFLESLTAPGRRVDVETPDPAVIQYEYDISGDSIFATPEQEAAYEQRSPYALQDSQDNPYGDSLISKIQGRLQKQQGLASGGAVKNKTNEILRILGER